MLQKRNSPIKSNPCKECGSIYHTRAFCPRVKKTGIKQSAFKQSSNVIRPNKHPMKRSRLKKNGKKSDRWKKTKEIFFAENTGDSNGLYWCKIKACPKKHVPMVAPRDPRLNEADAEVELCTVDHKIPRTKRPDLIFVQSNLQEAHGSCNSDKGSTVEVEYDDYGKVQRRRQTEAWLFVMSTDDLMARYLELLDMMEKATDDVIIRDLQHEIDFIEKLRNERQKPVA
jgi:5-methylcytosine-specific restriction endonuclease McrA